MMFPIFSSCVTQKRGPVASWLNRTQTQSALVMSLCYALGQNGKRHSVGLISFSFKILDKCIHYRLLPSIGDSLPLSHV